MPKLNAIALEACRWELAREGFTAPSLEALDAIINVRLAEAFNQWYQFEPISPGLSAFDRQTLLHAIAGHFTGYPWPDDMSHEATKTVFRANMEKALEAAGWQVRQLPPTPSVAEVVGELRALTRLAEVMNNRQHAGLPITNVIWSELHQVTNRAKAVISAIDAEGNPAN